MMVDSDKQAERKRTTPTDWRRLLVLVCAIGMLAGCLAMARYGEGGSSNFASGAMGRIGLVLAALWLAWPSLRRPASWLPPGIAAAGVLALAVLAAQPRLIVAAVPALGALLAVAAIVRTFK